MTKIKYNRAKKLSKIGTYHRSFNAMLERVENTDVLTAKQIAAQVDSLWGACQEAKTLVEA